jgi:PhnB protein
MACMTKFSAVYPRLVVRDAAAAIDCYAKVFDAEELERHTGDDGKIQHAMLRIGGVQVAVKDEDDYDLGPRTLGGSPVIMAVEVDDADVVGERMTAAGGSVIFPIQDWDYGQRGGRLADPYGHLWMIAQNL